MYQMHSAHVQVILFDFQILLVKKNTTRVPREVWISKSIRMHYHIPIIAPSTNEPLYVNRKGYHSINVQAKCDDEYRIIDAVVKWPGSTHDAFMWRQSAIHQKISSDEIQTVDGWFLGDSGYPIGSKLMTPILSPISSSQRRYNRAFF